MDQKYTFGVAHWAAECPPRAWQHIVFAAAYVVCGRGARRWARYSVADIVTIAVAYRLMRVSNLTAVEAMKLAIDTISPLLTGDITSDLARVEITLALADPCSPHRATVDVGEVASSVIERLRMIHSFTSPVSARNGQLRGAKSGSICAGVMSNKASLTTANSQN
jgi:hypothetical protein